MADESIERRRVTLLQPHQMGRWTLAAADGVEDPVRNDDDDDDDDDKRPVLPPRLLKRTRDENDAKVKGSNDDDAPSKMPSNAGTAKREWHAGEELIHTPPPLPSPPSTPAPSDGGGDGASNFDVPGTTSPPSPPPFASSAARGEGGDPATASRGSSRQHKGKSRKVSTGVCNRRLLLAFNAINSTQPGFFPGINEPEDVTTKLCPFVTPTSEDPGYNLGCPFVFLPANYTGTGVPPTNFFPKGVKEYVDLFEDLCSVDPNCKQNATAAGEAAASVALYCSCYQGYDLGCSSKVNSTPQDEYCEFAGVWNGDFNSTDVELSRETNDCGCFWISQVTNEVGNCPGVDLGNFFLPFTNAKDTLSALSSHNPS